MQIKEIMEISANLLNRQNLVEFLKSNTDNGDAFAEYKRLIELCNFVITDLTSLNFYIKNKLTQSISTSGIKLSSISNKLLKILGVYNNDGEQVDYVIKNDTLYPISEAECVIFAEQPSHMTVDFDFEFENANLTSYIVALGVCAEYCLVVADFDNAVVWHEKYVENIKRITKVKNFFTKQRSWV